MKKGIHPNYRIVYVVLPEGTPYQTRPCYKNDRMVLEIDSKSHPFYTGKQVLLDTAGRVDRFKKRFEKTQKLKETAQQEATA